MTRPINLKPNKIAALLVCTVLSFCLISSVSAQSNTTIDAQASTSQPQVGSTLTVTLKISSVQNLAGIDTTLQWNHSVLSLTTVVLNLGDSHSNGVLHGSNLNYDSDNLSSGDIYAGETKVSGSYNLVAQSIGQSNPGFNGSGTIATFTFNAISTGTAGLSLQTDLADHPPAGQIANNIVHQDLADSVTVVIPGSSSSPTPSPTPTTSPSLSPSPTASETPAPEPAGAGFPIGYLFAILGLLGAVITALAVLVLRKRK